MGAVERITLDLPQELVRRLRARVATGEFASESEAVVEALHGLDDGFEDDPAFRVWLQGPLARAYDEVTDGTAETLGIAEARKSLTLKRG